MTDKNIKNYNLEVEKVQEAVGQLSIFTAPVVILFFEGKEIYRQIKIIDFKELEYRISQVNEIV